MASKNAAWLKVVLVWIIVLRYWVGYRVSADEGERFLRSRSIRNSFEKPSNHNYKHFAQPKENVLFYGSSTQQPLQLENGSRPIHIVDKTNPAYSSFTVPPKNSKTTKYKKLGWGLGISLVVGILFFFAARACFKGKRVGSAQSAQSAQSDDRNGDLLESIIAESRRTNTDSVATQNPAMQNTNTLTTSGALYVPPADKIYNPLRYYPELSQMNHRQTEPSAPPLNPPPYDSLYD